MNRMNDFLKDGERIDDLERGGYRVIQNPGLFCFGMDAVLLSAFAKTKPTDRVLDLCSGNGIIPILLIAREKAKSVTGIEIQSTSADIFKRSVGLNGLEDRVEVICADIKDRDAFGEGEYDAVTCNPPYMSAGDGIVNPEDAKALARHEIMCDFADVAKAASKALKSGGKFFFVHRPRRLTEIFAALKDCGLEAKRMQNIHPKEGSPANMILVEAVKDGRVQMVIEPPLIVYDEKGEYTKEVRSMYYD